MKFYVSNSNIRTSNETVSKISTVTLNYPTYSSTSSTSSSLYISSHRDSSVTTATSPRPQSLASQRTLVADPSFTSHRSDTSFYMSPLSSFQSIPSAATKSNILSISLSSNTHSSLLPSSSSILSSPVLTSFSSSSTTFLSSSILSSSSFTKPLEYSMSRKSTPVSLTTQTTLSKPLFSLSLPKLSAFKLPSTSPEALPPLKPVPLSSSSSASLPTSLAGASTVSPAHKVSLSEIIVTEPASLSSTSSSHKVMISQITHKPRMLAEMIVAPFNSTTSPPTRRKIKMRNTPPVQITPFVSETKLPGTSSTFTRVTPSHTSFSGTVTSTPHPRSSSTRSSSSQSSTTARSDLVSTSEKSELTSANDSPHRTTLLVSSASLTTASISTSVTSLTTPVTHLLTSQGIVNASTSAANPTVSDSFLLSHLSTEMKMVVLGASGLGLLLLLLVIILAVCLCRQKWKKRGPSTHDVELPMHVFARGRRSNSFLQQSFNEHRSPFASLTPHAGSSIGRQSCSNRTSVSVNQLLHRYNLEPSIFTAGTETPDPYTMSRPYLSYSSNNSRQGGADEPYGGGNGSWEDEQINSMTSLQRDDVNGDVNYSTFQGQSRDSRLY